MSGSAPLVLLGVAEDPSTTIAATMSIRILESAGLEPGWALSSGSRPAPTRRKISGGAAHPAPWVVDDPGAAERYHAVLLVGELDLDLDLDLLQRVPESGLVMVNAALARVRAAVATHTRARIAFYGLDRDDTGDVSPAWHGAALPRDRATGVWPFDLYAGGSSCGRFAVRADDIAVVRLAVGAIGVCAEGFGVGVEQARRALATFEAVP